MKSIAFNRDGDSVTDHERSIHLPILSTGKSHVSFSEFATWMDCPHKHHLNYVDKVTGFTGNEHTLFGNHVHHGCERFIKERTIPIDEVCDMISTTWSERSLPQKDVWIKQARDIFSDVPTWMDFTFPGWEPIDAEHKLFEPMVEAGHPDIMWKGYVDVALSWMYGNKRKRSVVQLLDWKTTLRGWRPDKVRDFKIQAQLASYKVFWNKKFDIKMSNIKAGFVLLKRIAKPGLHCQLIDISIGPRIVERFNVQVSKMLKSLKTDHQVHRNKSSCYFCDFNGTQHCTGDGGWRWVG
jgi:hypothetical protein